MTSAVDARRGSDYSVLCKQVRDANLLARRRVNYTARIAITLAVTVGAWFVFSELGSSWHQLTVAAVLGLATTQIAFLGHDGGHQQITSKRFGNRWVGLIAGNLLTGLSIGWWIDKHNRHHANPNKEHHDPDIGEGVLAFTTEHAANRTGPVSRFITRHQASLFFPLLTLEGINLHVASIAWLRGNPTSKYHRVEAALLTAHMALYLGGVLLVLSPLHALAFIGVHQAVFGLYMGCSFAPNHKGMPIIAADEKVDYLRRQVLTSRNVRGGWLVDQLLGGLNYQIEHHLFPNMPRANLSRARRMVRQHCEQHRISYTETSLVTSYAMALRYLHSLGEPLRAAARARAQVVPS